MRPSPRQCRLHPAPETLKSLMATLAVRRTIGVAPAALLLAEKPPTHPAAFRRLLHGMRGDAVNLCAPRGQQRDKTYNYHYRFRHLHRRSMSSCEDFVEHLAVDFPITILGSAYRYGRSRDGGIEVYPASFFYLCFASFFFFLLPPDPPRYSRVLGYFISTLD